ncbi:MAG: glucose-6-phosphate dehydrogenase [Kiritimatiellae bacterium]|nr:glucose-6-phosphate dehydrogenase [Kiritimatiellia bacterium]
MTKISGPLDIVVMGASGDLARRKIFPALFSLFCQGYLPDQLRFFGFARSKLTDDEFRGRITEHLTCRYAPGESCADLMSDFLSRCRYMAGNYGSSEDMLDLYQLMQAEKRCEANILFYFAIPPSVFLDVSRALGDAGMIRCTQEEPWTRAVIEKPFGQDRESSDNLTCELGKVFTEDAIYRIDHYLGKEVIQNLMVLRFANLVFEPIWNRHYIERVWIDWREDLGLEGRAGYFDSYGVIRDVMQNHLLQILALIAMDKPQQASAQHVRDEKVKVLRRISPVTLDHAVLGQYGAATWRDKDRVGYRQEPDVSPSSCTPTFCAARLEIDNDRWRGVPFIVRAGKAMNAKENEVRIQFRSMESNLFSSGRRTLPPNELVVRIQPNEGIYLGLNNKEPGHDLTLEKRDLDLRYASAYPGMIPDAYECLLLDVMEGDKSLFIRSDELEAAWDIFTPLLHKIDEDKLEPDLYPFGSYGPVIDKILLD